MFYGGTEILVNFSLKCVCAMSKKKKIPQSHSFVCCNFEGGFGELGEVLDTWRRLYVPNTIGCVAHV